MAEPDLVPVSLVSPPLPEAGLGLACHAIATAATAAIAEDSEEAKELVDSARQVTSLFFDMRACIFIHSRGAVSRARYHGMKLRSSQELAGSCQWHWQ